MLGFVQYFFYSNLRNLFYLGWDDHLYRLFSVFLDPNFAAAFFVLFIIFLLETMLHAAKQVSIREQLIRKLLLVGTIIACALTFSRSGIIMFVVSLSVVFILEKKQKLIIPIIATVIIFLFAISPFFYLENINIFRTVSTGERIDSMSNAIQIIFKQPLFGVGFNAYKYAQVRMGFRQEQPAIASHADNGTDNSFLFILATTGVIGTAFFIFFWTQVFRNLAKKLSLLGIIGIASFVGICVDSLFINSLFFPSIMLWLWVVLGLNDYK